MVMDNGWLPIESAPKDENIWLYWPDAPIDSRQQVGWFETDTADGQRWVNDHDSMDCLCPTHWQPLPKPPEGIE